MISFVLTGCQIGVAENINATKLQKLFIEYNPNYFGMVPKVYDIISEKIKQEISNKGSIIKFFINLLLNFSGFIRRNLGLNIGHILLKSVRSKVFGKEIIGFAVMGSICKPETAKLFLNLGINWANVYGSTECNAPICSTGVHDKYAIDSVGNVYQFSDIDIKIQNTKDCSIGEIYIKSPMIMKEYFRDANATTDAFDGEYFKTGDLGYIDKKNFLHITGRSKESIILNNGEKVSAQDVDNIYQVVCPGVAIACCAVTNNDGTDEIHLFVETTDKSENDINQIIAALKKKSLEINHIYSLAGIHTIDKIPVTSIGKVKRYMLKEHIVDDCKDDSNTVSEHGNADSICEIVMSIITQHVKFDDEITLKSKLIDDLGLDSLSLFELCSEIENATGINISDKMYGVSTINDIVALLDSPIDDNKKSNYDIQKFPLSKKDSDIKSIARFMSLTERIYDTKIIGTENISQETKYIFCPNHESYFDAMWIAAALYKYNFDVRILCSMAAQHLMNNRLMKKAFIALGGIPVDRAGNTAPAIERALQCLKNDKCFMLIHPEGTRTRTGKLGEFKQGAAKLSIESGVKIIPVCINGAYEIFPPDRKLPRLFDWKHFCKYPLKIQFGMPIEPNGKNAAEITEEIRHQITEMKQEHNEKEVARYDKIGQ